MPRILYTQGKRERKTSVVEMGNGARIMVEPGAKLVVDGGTLTAGCYMWQGIEVWGDPGQPAPYTLVAGGAQGIVELKNGAVIENAVVGVRGGKASDCCNWSGGIVRANNATFKNCRKDVELMTYKFLSKSRFDNCTFLCDAPLPDENAYPNTGTGQFVSVWDQYNVRFNDCTFTNSYTGSGEFPQHLRGAGITAIDATIIALGNTYTGLSKGVDVKKTTLNTRRLMHYGSEFTNVAQGIISEGSTMDRVIGNAFAVPVTDQMAAWGIYMYRSRDHRVTDNTLDLYGTTPDLNWGIVNRGNKLTGGLIRGNDLDGLAIGTQTESHNPYLQILCNDYQTGMTYDWVNNPFSQGSYLGPQGTGCDVVDDYRAGNRFYNTGNPPILTWAQEYDYYYPDITEWKPGALTDWPEFCDQVSSDPSCDEEELHGLPTLHGKRLMLDSLIGELEMERMTVAAGLDSIGLKTDTLLAHIADTTYSKALLTTELVQWSLLTDTVLLAAVQREKPLDATQLQTVVVYNSPLSHGVWTEVKQLFDGMKQEIIDTIISAQSSDSLRTLGIIDREIAGAKTMRHRTIMDFLDGHLDKDSIIDSTYAAVDYMLTLNDKEFYKLAIGTTLSLDTLEWCRTLLDTMLVEDAEDTAFYDWHDLALTLREDTLTWFDLDSAEVEAIRLIAIDSTEMKSYAEAVLGLLGDTSMTRTPEPMPELPSERLGHDEDVTASEPVRGSIDEFLVYPNPLTNDFAVRFSLTGKAETIKFEVFDVTGRMIREALIRDAQKGEQRIDLTPCSGLYLLRVLADGEQVYSNKLICVER